MNGSRGPRRDHQPLIGDAVINDGPGILLIVEKFPWANTLDVTRGVEQALRSSTRARGHRRSIVPSSGPASFIDQAFGNLSNALLLGSILVFVVLIVFLFDWRTALISLVAIPLSLMAAAMVLYLRDVTINTMILAGFVISVGVVVDDAIIDIENITRRLRQHRLAGSAPVHRVDHPRVVARSPQRDRLRDPHRRRRCRAHLLHRGPVRRLLPAPRHLVRAGRPCLAARRPDGDAGAWPSSCCAMPPSSAAVADLDDASGRLWPADRSHPSDEPSGIPDRRDGEHGRDRHLAAARPVATARLQGA